MNAHAVIHFRFLLGQMFRGGKERPAAETRVVEGQSLTVDLPVKIWLGKKT